MKTGIRHYVSLFAAAVLLAGIFAGCRSDAVTAETETQDPFAPPSFSQIAGAVSLDDSQGETVKAALADWRETSASQSGQRRAGIRRGEGPRALMTAFVAQVAPSLDTNQLTEMVAFVVEHQRGRMEAMRGQMRGRRGGHGPGGRGPDGGLFAELDLTEQQQVALKEARDAMHETKRALHDQLREGAITEEEFRAQADAARDTMQAAVADILTEEQLAQLEELRSERMNERLERRLERLGDRIDEKLDFMTRVAGLSEAQQAAVRAIMESAVEHERAIIESILAGETTHEDGRTALHELRTQTREAIEAELTEEQLARLEAVRPLRRGPGPGPRP